MNNLNDDSLFVILSKLIFFFYSMEEISIDTDDLPVTHFFLYKEKQFPFNMNIFKCFSQYFNSDEHQYEENSIINLFDESEEYSESSINDFINFCQHKKIKLNSDNIFPLHKLAKKYIVPSLIKSTNKYISMHQKDILIDLLLKSQDEEDTSSQEYEEALSNSLIQYIQDDRLLSFPIPVLHRAVTKYTQKNNNQNIDPEERSKLIEFLFKCLDHFGRSGSILFDSIDIGCSGGFYVQKLLNEYSEKFDFHYINDKQLKNVYELENEMIKQAHNLRETESETKTEIEKMKEEMNELKKENARLKISIEETNQSKDSQIQRIQEEHSEKIHHIESTFNSKLNDLRNEMSRLIQRVTSQNDLIDQLNGRIVELERPRISCHFLGPSDPRGIISSLGESVNLIGGGFINQKYPITNITKFDSTFFLNSNGSTPKSETHSFIKFDFGPSKKIDLYSYFIRSNLGSPSNYSHPKSWRIMGSNDCKSWCQIDRQKNVEDLNGQYHQHHFECKNASHGSNSSRFRYIKYIQEDSWLEERPYNVYITYFELYGDIFNYD